MTRRSVVGLISVVVIAGLVVLSRKDPIDTGPEYLLFRTQSELLVVGHVLMVYREEIGRFPTADEGLSVLGQPSGEEGPFMRNVELIQDAWGKPLIYQPVEGQTGASFLLYSLGPDGVDDGGQGDDISFWSEPVQKRLVPL